MQGRRDTTGRDTYQHLLSEPLHYPRFACPWHDYWHWTSRLAEEGLGQGTSELDFQAAGLEDLARV